MRTVWTQDTPSFGGEFCTFPPLKALPKPVQQPHPPVLFGGNSAPALRRAVVNGDGWFGFNVSPAEAAPLVQRLRQYAEGSGRNFDDVIISLALATKLPQVTLDDLKRYRDAGVQQVTVRLPTAHPEHIEAALDDLAERLVVPAQAL
jgi:alkanesulfonate monooxygenase SsuD/methylene tetrahydromethanopterin reductase-like flavin-dependent oxidoreductase (luciferase family)